jgi:hypothetical protein
MLLRWSFRVALQASRLVRREFLAPALALPSDQAVFDWECQALARSYRELGLCLDPCQVHFGGDNRGKRGSISVARSHGVGALGRESQQIRSATRVTQIKNASPNRAHFTTGLLASTRKYPFKDFRPGTLRPRRTPTKGSIRNLRGHSCESPVPKPQ